MSRTDALTDALVGSSLVSKVWHSAEQDGVVTLMLVPTGDSEQAKNGAMERLARILIPNSEGRILLAKQFLYRGGKLGVSWNFSVFGDIDRYVREKLEGVAGPKMRHRPTAPANTPVDDAAIPAGMRVLENTEYRTVIAFPLPNVSGSDRNIPANDESKGARQYVQSSRKHGRWG